MAKLVAMNASGQAVGATHNGRYVGCRFRETSGSASATIRIWQGVAATPSALANLVDEVALASGASGGTADAVGIENQTQFVGGLYFEVVSGAVEGVIKYV